MKEMIKAKDGSYVRRSEIVSVTADGRNKLESKIVATDGKTYIVKAADCDIAEDCEFFEEAIPAHPGYSMLVTEYDKKCRKIHYRKIPIVGWVRYKNFEDHQVEETTYPFWAMPVFGGYYNFGGKNYTDWGLLLLDGRVIDCLFLEHRNLEEFLKAKTVALKKPCMLV